MIGVVGPDDAAGRLVGAIGDRPVRAGAVRDVLADDPDVVVALGERALSDLASAGARVPVLPVDVGPGIDAVEESRVPAVLERGLGEGFETRDRPVLAVESEEEPAARGVFDATLVTAEPSRISEYAVETPDGTDQFRADGVVVATPAGSHGYVRALDGPVLAADAETLVVAPVGAFAIRPTDRVVGTGSPVSIRVERDVGAVSLFVDGTERRSVSPGRPVTVAVVDELPTVVTSPDGPRRLEKL